MPRIWIPVIAALLALQGQAAVCWIDVCEASASACCATDAPAPTGCCGTTDSLPMHNPCAGDCHLDAHTHDTAWLHPSSATLLVPPARACIRSESHPPNDALHRPQRVSPIKTVPGPKVTVRYSVWRL
ncbi:MAG: hypothetical protein ACPGTR_01020 [Opitutales bacterium]